MKKIICIILITVTSILSGCNSTSDEEIISSQDFKENYEVSSYGTEEKINTLSDVELTSSEKEYSDLENAKFFLENNSNKEYHYSKAYFEIEAEQSVEYSDLDVLAVR